MDLRQSRLVYISIYLVWLFLLLAPLFPVASGQTNVNYNSLCNNYPDGQCQFCCHGLYILYSNPNGTGIGRIIYPSECNVPNSVCEKWTTYGSVVSAVFPAGYQYTVGPYYVAGLFTGLGLGIVQFFTLLLIVIPLVVLIWILRRKPTVSSAPNTTTIPSQTQ
jgi:hypothetical protein